MLDQGIVASVSRSRYACPVALAPLISIVDDDASMREAISLSLRGHGLRTEVFDSAGAFLAAVATLTSACIIVDVRMPGISGLELQRRLARLPGVPPIIIVSAHVDDHVEKQALRAGALAVLSKPFTEETLLHTVRLALEG